MFAALELWDYGIITLIVIVFAGGSSAAHAFFKPPDASRLRRLEEKLDLVLTHLGLQYVDAVAVVSADVKALADQPGNKIAAIKLHREQTGAGLAEAKDAVEAYMAGRG